MEFMKTLRNLLIWFDQHLVKIQKRFFQVRETVSPVLLWAKEASSKFSSRMELRPPDSFQKLTQLILANASKRGLI